MNLKKLLKLEATWYFMALAGLLILVYMGGNIIIDTYFYLISLNVFVLLFSYTILKIKKTTLLFLCCRLYVFCSLVYLL